MITYALDTETFYSKEYSVSNAGYWHYTHDDRFDCYLLTIAGDNGFEYCGRPEDFDWSLLEGSVLVSHNAPFDRAVVARLVELGKIPAFEPAAWHCSMDMCAWSGLPRSLANACDTAFGIKPDKSIRDNMVGKKFEDLPIDKRNDLSTYAMQDARLCLKLWQKYSDGWPDLERRLSRHTGDIGVAGVPVVKEELEAAIRTLSDVMWQAEQEIPWSADAPILSPKQLAIECGKVGITPPKSLAKDSPECQRWEERYGDEYPWVGAMRNWRRANTLKAKVETMLRRFRADTGRCTFELKYFGAGMTGRWSGGGGWNCQNLGKEALFGVDMRALISAPEGKTFAVVDLSQIEPRVLAMLSRNMRLLRAVREGFGIYEAHAIGSGMWSGEKGTLKKSDPKLYACSKAQVLALGYNAGPGRFMDMSPALTGGEYCPDAVESERVVADFRARNKCITNLWKTLNDGLRASVNRDYTVDLPSNRSLTYRKVSSVGGLTALTPRNGRLTRTKVYGGLLTENCCQGLARDIFATHIDRLVTEGFEVLWHVHDEVICLVDEETAEQDLQRIIDIMSTAPEWASGLPLAAEGELMERYRK